MIARKLANTASTAKRSMALLLAAALVSGVTPAAAEPGDIFSVAVPVAGTAPEASKPIAHGDVSVARQTGALQYAYPITVPPGRNGVQPHLSLAYSSQAPIYGGIASGWTLSGVPIISEDTSHGRTWEQLHGKRFTSSLSGGRPLVPVTEPTAANTVAYRAQNDASFIRYQKQVKATGFWTAYATDGTVYYFGEQDAHKGTCTTFSESYAPLTHTTDPFGNVVDYMYSAGADGECALVSISWGANANASIAHFATATFNYTLRGQSNCPYGSYPGSATSYRTGTKIVTGAARLDNITITAYPPGQASTPDHTRVITLAYTADSQSCSTQHSPYRELASFQESAWGTDSPRVDLPAVRFTYGNSDFGTGTLRYAGSAPTALPWIASTVASVTDAYNLGWGYRFTDGTWPTVEAMMVDIDGDGLVDRVVDASMDSTGHVTSCRARWLRNPGGGRAFVDMGYIPLPTLKWASQTPFADGGWARSYPSGGARERCSLNFQLTGYVNSHNTGADLVCRGQSGATYGCPNGSGSSGYCDHSTADQMYGDDCIAKTYNNNARYTYLAYRWVDFDGDGKVDLVAAPTEGGFAYYNLQAGNNVGAPVEPALFGTWPTCPPLSNSTAYPGDPNRPYTMCGGMFPWFVYKNKGNGVFGTQQSGRLVPDEIHYQPIPLETTTGDSSVTSNPVGQLQGWVDIDGDGRSDAVAADPTGNSNFWKVFINDGTGQLVPAAPYVPFSFTTPAGVDITLNDCLTSGACSAVGVEGLLDMNGDGLVDEWSSVPNGAVAGVALNDGLSFRLVNGGGELTVNRPATDGTTVATDVGPGNPGFVRAGTRADYRRTFDVDLDGRPDLITPSSTNTPDTHFNIGIDFGAGQGNLDDGFAINHMIVVAESNCSGASCQGQIPDYMAAGAATYTWELRSDMVDLDGDSVPEGINFGADYSSRQMLQSHVDPTVDAQPPRLLIGVDNQRGATSAVTYAPVVGSQAVTQEPTKGKATPRTGWVVASVTDSDSVSATTSTTTYSYLDPHWSPDDEGRWGFRGFDQVTSVGPSGASTIERYSYSPDWSGRLGSTLVQPASSEATVSGETRSIDDTFWEARASFGGAITTYHPTTRDHWTCANGQTEAACRLAMASHTRTYTTLAQLHSNTTSDPTALLWVETDVRSMLGTAFADGDRTQSTQYRLASDAFTYRLRKSDDQSYVQVVGTQTSYAHHIHSWDPTLRVLQAEVAYPNATTKAVTEYTYDMATGNVLTRRKPQQYATSGPLLQYTYDSRKLFLASEIDELHDVLTHTYEYGTGTKLETQGPNTASCVATANCPAGTVPKQDHRIRIDGIGRTIETWEAFGDSGGNYFPYKVGVDTYSMTIPNGVTHQQAISLSGYTVNYATSRTDYDGHGRQVRSTLYASGAAVADKVTTFHYSNQGTVSSIDTPDPSANDASVVTYRYTADSLGRITSFRRPDNATAASQSGINVAFNGLQQTTSEVVGAAGGQVGVTTLFHDPFNRIVEVDETALSNPPQFAATHYTYSPDDNVATIVDPEGVTTTLTHDFVGNRTAVTRGTRTWSYSYDLNGNMTGEVQPCSPQPTCAADYTSSTVYDALDRPASRLLAHGPLSANPTDIDYFGADHEVFTWDGSQPNARGTLVDWATYGRTGPQILESAMTHDAQAHVLAETSTFMGAGFNATRTLTDAYNLGGNVATTNYGDAIGTTQASTSALSYDARGLLSNIVVSRQDGSNNLSSAISYTRNVDALVTNIRKYVVPSVTNIYVESNWSYDKLGRVAKQVVQKDSGHTLLAEQDLAYFGTDDPQSLDHWLGASNHKHFAYLYDARHQLTNVSETAYPNAFTAAYTYGPAGRFATANENAAALPGSQVKPRNVSYHYAGTDPEEVTSLTQAGATFATYTYDLAGNQTSRSYPSTGETWNFTYDGKAQLRRVAKFLNGVPQGTEEYWYDADGARAAIVKRDSVGAKQELITFLRDVESHYDGTGALNFVYAYVEAGTPIGRITHSATAASLELEFHGLANSTLATVATDSSTEIVNASFDYAPFGEVIESTNEGGATAGVPSHSRQFNDKYADGLSSLDYYGVRYYDPLANVWTQGDPLVRFAPETGWDNPRHASLYAFDANNPLRYIDPDGRYWFSFWNEVTKPLPEISVTDGKVTATPQEQSAAGYVAAVVLDKASTVIVNQLIGNALERWGVTGPTATSPSLPDDGPGGTSTPTGGGDLGGGDVGDGTPSGGPTSGTSSSSGGARFVGQPDGQVVDTHSTPAGSWDQPDGSRTDILQKEDHGAGHSHTHRLKTNTNPKTGKTYINGRQHEKEAGPVSKADVDNIKSGQAVRTKPKNRE